MRTPSWDFIRVSSWRTLMMPGYAPMICSGSRCTISAKDTRSGQSGYKGRLRMGEVLQRHLNAQPPLCIIHTCLRNYTGFQMSITETCRHIGYMPSTEMRSVPLLRVHRSIKSPFPYADLHDAGELKYLKMADKEKNVPIYLHHFSFMFGLNVLYPHVFSSYSPPCVLSACLIVYN